MIEIVLDQNEGDTFLNEIRPVVEINEPVCGGFPAYRQKAREVVEKYALEKIIIIRNQMSDFSINFFALALFVEACLLPNGMECAVIKVKDYPQALRLYKPFVALTIGIKYVMRLCAESAAMIYKEISGLGYLGLEIKNDYLNNKIFLTLPGKEEVRFFKAETVSEALILTGMLKSLALAQTGAAIRAEINIAPAVAIDENLIINQIVEMVSPWIKP